MRASTAIAALLLAGVVCTGAMAVEKPPAGSTPVPQGPYFDARTGSYFELRLSKGIKPNWHNTMALASQLTYKGRRGRLAVVKDIETLDFLRENFRFNDETWIGLRFFCGFRKLLWVTGEIQPLNSPGMWAPQWYANPRIRCRATSLEYMPVFITQETGSGVVSLQATGPAKYQESYIVEYPAPPSDEKASDQTDTEASAN